MRAKQDVRDETTSLDEKIATATQKSTNIKQSGSECSSISLPTIIL
jgi:cell division protein FtsL